MRKILLIGAAVAVVGAAAVATAHMKGHHGGEWRHGGGHGYGHHMDGGEHYGRGGGRGWREGRRRGGRMGARLNELFETADADGDGGLSTEELANARTARFEAMDADASGAVSAEELAAYRMKRRAARWIARRDDNSDGELSLDEMPDPSRRLSRFDLNEDGVVTRTEVRIAAPGLLERGERRRGRGRDAERGDGVDGDAGPAE